MGPPPPWLEVAIESGLVEMMQHEPGEPFCCGWLEQIDKNAKIPEISKEDLELMMAAGLLGMWDNDK